VKNPSTALAATCLFLRCSAAAAGPGELVLLAPANLPMPMADIADGTLRGGIIKDMGELLAAKLGRKAVFVVVPGRRVQLALAQGKADGVCMVKQGWIDGDYNWSAEVIPTGGVVLARADAPVIGRLTELRGKKVGTVAGYRYRMMNTLLGPDFLRDDAPSGEHNMRKLLAGRTQYALMELSSAAYQIRNDKTHSLRMDLTYETDMARCAFAQTSQVPFAQVSGAIDGMVAERSVHKIMAHYTKAFP
jgi:polar amino acid transport system substrate-binding protein